MVPRLLRVAEHREDEIASVTVEGDRVPGADDDDVTEVMEADDNDGEEIVMEGNPEIEVIEVDPLM